jgi:hypothetical protein
MTEKERLEELEKIADQLGIGQNRKVKCVSCKKVILFRKAILLTNKGKVSHLCKECNSKLTKGELTKKQIASDDILKEIEKLKRDGTGTNPMPYIPRIPDMIPNEKFPPMIPDDITTVPWKPVKEPYTMPWRIGDVTYTNYTYSISNHSDSSDGRTILKLEPNKNKYDRTN